MARTRSERIVRVLAAALLAAVLLDVGLGALVLRDGLLGDRPLPPFGALTHPRQRAWLEEQRARTEPDAAAAGAGVFDAELGWTLRPGHVDPMGIHDVDSLGARGWGARAATPLPGVLRVVTYGDSYTWCDGAWPLQSWQARMEAIDGGLEVLNLGVPGYGTDQALLRFRRRGLLGARVAVIGLLLENAGRNVNRYRPLWYPRSGAAGAKPRLRLEDGELVAVPLPFARAEELLDAVEDGSVLDVLAPHEHWPRHELGPLRWSSLARLAAGWRAYRARDVRALWTADGEPRRVTLALLDAFVREARAAGADVAGVVVFPRRDDLLDRHREGRPYWSALLEHLEARGVPHLDASEVLLPALRAEGPEPRGDSLYSGGHLSPRGNALIGERAAAWVRELVAGG